MNNAQIIKQIFERQVPISQDGIPAAIPNQDEESSRLWQEFTEAVKADNNRWQAVDKFVAWYTRESFRIFDKLSGKVAAPH